MATEHVREAGPGKPMEETDLAECAPADACDRELAAGATDVCAGAGAAAATVGAQTLAAGAQHASALPPKDPRGAQPSGFGPRGYTTLERHESARAAFGAAGGYLGKLDAPVRLHTTELGPIGMICNSLDVAVDAGAAASARPLFFQRWRRRRRARARRPRATCSTRPARPTRSSTSSTGSATSQRASRRACRSAAGPVRPYAAPR